MEPQIDADERRLNESAEKIFKVAFEVSNILDKNFLEKVYYKKQSGFKLRLHIKEIIDKSSAVNLRSSAVYIISKYWPVCALCVQCV